MYTFLHSLPRRVGRVLSPFFSRVYNLFDLNQLLWQHDLKFMQSKVRRWRKKMSQSLWWDMLGEDEQIPWETPKRIDDKMKDPSAITIRRRETSGGSSVQSSSTILPKATCALACADFDGQEGVKWRRQKLGEEETVEVRQHAQPPQPQWWEVIIYRRFIAGSTHVSRIIN